VSVGTRTGASLTAALLTLTLMACGGGSRSPNASSNGAAGTRVPPAAYVQSICATLGGWKTDAAVARMMLAREARATGSLLQSKQQYVSFVSALASSSRNAAGGLRAAGIPGLSSGDRFATGLVGAFTRATGRLASAASEAGAIPTMTGAADYQRAALALSRRIRRSLPSVASITRVTMARYPELAALEAKDPGCGPLALPAPSAAPLVPGIG